MAKLVVTFFFHKCTKTVYAHQENSAKNVCVSSIMDCFYIITANIPVVEIGAVLEASVVVDDSVDANNMLS